jgi:hypothetical protein
LITTIRSQTKTLSIFISLQCLDALTTLVFLSKGVREGSPLVSLALSHAPAPWVGLAATKVAALLIGQYCFHTGRMAILRRANLGYSLLVAWNLASIAAAGLAH